MEQPMPHQAYVRLLLMAILSFVSMYVLMYMMVDRFVNVYPHLNQVYMAGLMTAPMIIIELALMGAMYPNRRRNATLMIVSVLAGLAFIAGIRTQAGVNDEQFLKSMIPHHGGAILMCEQAPLADPELQTLCRSIIAEQQAEIDLMRAKLLQR